MSSNKKMILGALLAASCAIVCLAMTVQAQYNTFDSDSNSDSEGGQILSNAELGKLMRGSAKVGRGSNFRNYNQQQQLAATKNLYNKQQPLQYAPTQHNRRQFSPSDLSGYNPLGAAASSGQSNANNDDDDNESENFGPNFGANYDGNEKDGEGGVQADGQPMNLNQAASGYPNQGDYNEGAGFNFAGNGGYGASADSGDYGGEGFGGDGRRAKSASSLMGRGMGDDDAGASQYGPNSAVNSGDDDEGRSGYAPEASNDNDNDNDDESLLVTGPFLRLLYSLGQGISCAAGMAFAGKRVDKTDYNVFCVLGDGESAEGSVWEAFAFASTHKLDNLFAIIDVNRQGQSEPAALGHQMDVYEARCKAFGMETYNIDGHSVAELVEAFATAKASKNGKPKAIICKTLKGKGFPDIEDLKEDHL